MARISRYPVFAHLRSDASSHVIRYNNGKSVRSGRGLSFWFRPLNSAIAEVPLDDKELSFLFRGRSADLQEVVAQGIITWRVTDADLLATRIDFGVDIATGQQMKTPLDQIGGRLTSLAQQHAWAVMVSTSLRDLVVDGVTRLRAAISDGLAAESSLAEMGLMVVSVRVGAVQPSAEVEKELAAPTREKIAGEADEAAFSRRAAAVDKERAIAENELANRIELARRTADLVSQEGANEQAKAKEAAAAARISAESIAEQRKVSAGAEAETIKLVETERNAVESERIAIYRDLAPAVLMGLAAREFAGKVQNIEHLNLTPDLLGTLVTDFLTARTPRGEAGTTET